MSSPAGPGGAQVGCGGSRSWLREGSPLRLIACGSCHTQYDVSDVAADRFPCRCGETLENRALKPLDAAVHRCASCGALVNPETEACAYCGSIIEHDPSRLSLICPECYARTPDEARFCTSCGVAFRPEPVRVDGHELPCPACGGRMPPRQVGGVAVNECPRCHGLWVGSDGFAELVNRAIEARRSADPEGLGTLRPRVTGGTPTSRKVEYRKCPECDAFMRRRNFRQSSGVIIDECRRHGTWLDADELEEIAGFILSGGETSPYLERETAQADAQAAAALARLQALHRNPAGRDRRGALGPLLDFFTGILG